MVKEVGKALYHEKKSARTVLFEIRIYDRAGLTHSQTFHASQMLTLVLLLYFSSLEFSNTKVYEPSIRTRLGTSAHFCQVFVLKC